MNPKEQKDLLHTAKKIAIGNILALGIKDDITVNLAPRRLNSQNRHALGWYERRSQMSKGNPYVVVNIHNHVAAMDEDDNLLSLVVDTILHEYGHAIEEWITFEAPAPLLKRFEETMNDNTATYGETDFAEFFCRFATQHESFTDAAAAKQEAMKDMVEWFAKDAFLPEPSEANQFVMKI